MARAEVVTADEASAVDPIDEQPWIDDLMADDVDDPIVVSAEAEPAVDNEEQR